MINYYRNFWTFHQTCPFLFFDQNFTLDIMSTRRFCGKLVLWSPFKEHRYLAMVGTVSIYPSPLICAEAYLGARHFLSLHNLFQV